MRVLWFAGGLAWRCFRRAPLLFLAAVVVFLWVVQGWTEPWESPVCERHPESEVCR